MSTFISEEDQAAMAKSFAKRQQAAEEGGYAGFVDAAHKQAFEESARYHNLGLSNVGAQQQASEVQNRRAAELAGLNALATPLVDQYLPTFAFTAEERKQVEELLRKGLRE